MPSRISVEIEAAECQANLPVERPDGKGFKKSRKCGVIKPGTDASGAPGASRFSPAPTPVFLHGCPSVPAAKKADDSADDIGAILAAFLMPSADGPTLLLSRHRCARGGRG